MSRGRQKRVEKAQERRQESKKKKVRKEIRSFYKALVQNQLFPLLEKFNAIDVKSQSEKLHIWVDTLPCSRDSNDDVLYDDEDKSKKNRKKNSKGGGASPAVKKAHPRSSNENSEDIAVLVDEPLLCRNHFFTGECQGLKSGKSKKSGPSCRHAHYPSKQITLANALKSKNGEEKICDDEISCAEALKRASNAAAISQIKLDDTAGNNGSDLDKVEGIDMLYHMEISLISRTLEEELKVSELVSKTLVSEKVPISGIAYVAYSNVLLFDRFGGGKVLDQDTEVKLFDSADPENETNTVDSNQECDNIINLSGPVLELILSYLPDEYSGIVPSICKTFYDEIGTSSPALWKYLLLRHEWPVLNDAHDEDKDPIAGYKDSFVNHFSVCRRVKILANGICEVLHSEADVCGLKGSAVIKFGANQDTQGNYFSNMCFWDESSVLVASRNDCFLRLFNVSKQNSKNLCKHVLELRVAPVPISKRITCSLKSLAVDDRYLVCSYLVGSDFVVTSMMKDNLLKNSMEESILSGEILQSHDLTNSFFEFRDMNVDNDKYHYLRRPLDDEDERNNFHVVMYDGIHACGNGVFCASIQMFHSRDNTFTEADVLFNGILTFSASKGREFVLDFVRIPTNSNPHICTNYHRKKRIEPTEVVCKIRGTAELYLVMVDRSGKFQASRHLYRGLALTDCWQFEEPLFLEASDRPNVFSLNGRTSIVTSYLLSLSSNHESAYKRVAITMQQKESSDDFDTPPSTILLRNSYRKILSLKFIDEDYLMIICACHADTANPEEVVDWRLFGPDGEPNMSKKFDLVVIQIASMTEIHCSSIRSSEIYEDEAAIPTLVDITKKGAMAVVVGDMGLCITGAMASYQGDEKLRKIKKVKIKKRLVARTGKGGKRQGTGLLKL